MVKGKVSYMSPEQADAREIDRRSDIFALGIVFWECLTGRRLFGGSDDLHTLRLIREAAIEPPSSVVTEIDPRVEAVVMRMLAARREDRYAACEEICAALTPLVHEGHADAAAMQRFLRELGPSPAGAPAGNSELVTVAVDERGPRRATAELAPAKRSRRPVVVAALALVAVRRRWWSRWCTDCRSASRSRRAAGRDGHAAAPPPAATPAPASPHRRRAAGATASRRARHEPAHKPPSTTRLTRAARATARSTNPFHER